MARWPQTLTWLRWRLAVWLGRHEAALPALTAWLQLHPHDRVALATRAHVNGVLGLWSTAIKDLLILTQHAPAHAAHWFNLGFAQEQGGQLCEAEASFRRAVALAPALHVAHYGLGVVLQRQGRWAEAAPQLTEHTRLQPWCPDGWERLVEVHLSSQRPDLAQGALDQLAQFAPQRALALSRTSGLAF